MTPHELARPRTWNGPLHQAAGFPEWRGGGDWRAFVGSALGLRSGGHRHATNARLLSTCAYRNARLVSGLLQHRTRAARSRLLESGGQTGGHRRALRSGDCGRRHQRFERRVFLSEGGGRERTHSDPGCFGRFRRPRQTQRVRRERPQAAGLRRHLRDRKPQPL